MGIIADLSRWQNDVDFSQLKGQVDGVILRVQYGTGTADTQYQTYVKGCKDNGIPFASYAYFLGHGVDEATSALARVDKDSVAFAVDIEQVIAGVDPVIEGQTFIDYLKANGVKNVGLYCGEYFYNLHNLGAIKADWTWIANYGANDGQQHTAPKIDGVDLWQFTSVGHLAGVTTNVDESIPMNGFNLFAPHIVVTPAVAPSVPTSASAPVIDAPDTYTVVKGDSLSKIAVKFGLSVTTLQNLNGISDPNLIKIGQVLNLKTAVQKPQAPQAPQVRKLFLPASNQTWTVYKLAHPCIKSNPDNIAGVLKPAKFGGLVYSILADHKNGVYEIQTGDFGRVQIYASPNTKAIIK